METRKNAVSVPMFTISSSRPIGVSEAVSATTAPMASVTRIGVPVFGWVRANRGQQVVAAHGERHPDRSDHQRHHHGRQARDRPRRDQRRVAVLAHAMKAVASAAFGLMSVYFTIPVITRATAT